MNKEELRKKFEQNVEYLRKNIPPDDIYMFAEQTFMAAMFFIHKWQEWVDLNQACKEDPVANKWVLNILSLHLCRDEQVDIDLDLNLESIEDD